MEVEQKYNILLDPLPEEWNGYPIDSDFQTGILIQMALSDRELSPVEQIDSSIDLLFPERQPPVEEALDAIIWFLYGWYTDNLQKAKEDKTTVTDWQVDQWRIWAAFKHQYRIDLNQEKVHFWVFMALLSNLEECSYTRVADIRGKKLTGKMSVEERAAYIRAKAINALDSKPQAAEYSDEEKQKIDAFDERKRKAAAKKKALEAFRELTGE